MNDKITKLSKEIILKTVQYYGTNEIVTGEMYNEFVKQINGIIVNRLDLQVIPKIAEETSRFCMQELREEFLLNTQNYPEEYHNMFHKKAKRVIDKINQKYGSNFSV